MTTTATPEVREGSPLGPWVRDTGLENWNRFAAVNDEFVSIHMDDAAGQKAGMAGAIGMGNLLVSYAHAALRDWMGPQGRLVSVDVSFRRPNTRGSIAVSGTVTAVRPEGDTVLADLDLAVKDAEGNPLTTGSATVAFPASAVGA